MKSQNCSIYVYKRSWLSQNEDLRYGKGGKDEIGEAVQEENETRDVSIGKVPTSLPKHLSFVRNKMEATWCPFAAVIIRWRTGRKEQQIALERNGRP
jgi:hypothetical protein